MRIGHGYDAHRFAAGDKVILGGVSIAHDKGLQAHSDGDVLIHALCDALLGAAALGDIGKHFPDSNVEFKNIDSRLLLRQVMRELRNQHWEVANTDMTIVAQEPRLSPYIRDMCNNIASDLNIPNTCVNVKATTTEGMGFTGRAEGISAHAVVLLVPHD